MQVIAVPLCIVIYELDHLSVYIDKARHICAFLKYYQTAKQVFTLRSCLPLAAAVLHVWAEVP